MSRLARLAVPAVLLAALAAPAAAQEPPPAGPGGPVGGPSPCADPALRCPDLLVQPPSELKLVRTRDGRRLLGSRNILMNLGTGPLSLHGERIGRRTMRVAQRLYRVGAGFRLFALPDARLDFWRIPGQGRYWKLRDGLRFELWTAGEDGEAFVKTGRKTRFCMRDLRELPRRPGPRERVFPACSQNDRARTVRMGISVGWVESYPAGYHEQYVDVTGLRGCFSLRHIADPFAHVYEANEGNNMAATRLRLPGRPGRRPARC